jgi:hypothetical protein
MVMSDNDTSNANPVDLDKFVDDFIKKVVELTEDVKETTEAEQ